MKPKRVLQTLLPAAALILAFLPWGVALSFMSDPSLPPQVTTTSYFDLLPFGYGNFAPLITAVLTCVLLVLMLVHLATGSRKLRRAGKILAWAAAVISVFPVVFSAYTLIGGLISICLAGDAVMLTTAEKEEN